jgi:peptidoglycan/xylan/chitin deacetylase (PgdA/CDA1 family)
MSPPGSIVGRNLARRLFTLLVVVGLGFGTSVAGASRSHPQPLGIQSATLAQSAQDLVWSVSAQTPFSPAALGAAGRSLCLLIERDQNTSVAGQVCMADPAPGGTSPRVTYQHITRAGPGPATVIAATITRTGARNLTVTLLPSAIDNDYRSMHWQVLSTLKSSHCSAPGASRIGCFTVFPAVPPLARLHTPQLVGCTAEGPAFVDNGPSSGREIALTFDDGPWPDTPQFLDILEHYKVPATFFEIGRQIATYGEDGALERRMLADGDMVGDHTWSHPDVAGAGAFAQAQIEDAAAAIRTATHGFTPCLFRAPYGDVSSALISEARSFGFTTIQWDIDPRDWALPGVSEIYDNVVDNAHPGAIVLQHDGGGNRSETLTALPQEIQTLRSRGYRFVTITQLLGQRLIYR